MYQFDITYFGFPRARISACAVLQLRNRSIELILLILSISLDLFLQTLLIHNFHFESCSCLLCTKEGRKPSAGADYLIPPENIT